MLINDSDLGKGSRDLHFKEGIKDDVIRLQLKHFIWVSLVSSTVGCICVRKQNRGIK